METNSNEGKSTIGKIVHVYIDKHSVSIELIDKVKVGDTILLGDDDTYAECKIGGLKIEGIGVQKGFSGDVVEVNTDLPVREGSRVYRSNR